MTDQAQPQERDIAYDLKELRAALHVNELRNSGTRDGNVYAKWGSTVAFALIEIKTLRDRLRTQPSPREAALEKALQDVRQELWVDYCLRMGRTDTDPRPFNSKPHIRIIDGALASDGREGNQ